MTEPASAKRVAFPEDVHSSASEDNPVEVSHMILTLFIIL
jgi:hypothetical protein